MDRFAENLGGTEINIFERLLSLAHEKSEHETLRQTPDLEIGSSLHHSEPIIEQCALKEIKQELDDDLILDYENVTTKRNCTENPSVGFSSHFEPAGFLPLSHFSIAAESIVSQKNRIKFFGAEPGGKKLKESRVESEDENFTLIELSHCDAISSARVVQIIQHESEANKGKTSKNDKNCSPRGNLSALSGAEEAPNLPVVKIKKLRKRRSDFGEKAKKKVKLIDDVQGLDDVLDLWEAKLELQVACGFGSTENLPVNYLITEAVNRVESLHYQREVACQTSHTLLKEQKRLFYKLVKLLHGKRKRQSTNVNVII